MGGVPDPVRVALPDGVRRGDPERRHAVRHPAGGPHSQGVKYPLHRPNRPILVGDVKQLI